MPQATLVQAVRPRPQKAGGNCGKCSKAMPTTKVTVAHGSTIRFHMNGITMSKFFVNAGDLDLQFCVRCQTYTLVAAPIAAPSQ